MSFLVLIYDILYYVNICTCMYVCMCDLIQCFRTFMQIHIYSFEKLSNIAFVINASCIAHV